MDEPDELFDRADQQERDGNPAAALESWRRLSRIRPTCTVFCRLARLEKRLGHTAETKLAFQKAIDADRSCNLAYIGLASIALEDGEYNDAEVLLSIALQHEENAVAYCLRGLAFDGLSKADEAAGDFSKALEIDPAYEEAHFNLGVLRRDTDPGRAEHHFRSAIRHAPEYAEAHRELGWLLSRVGNASDGESHLRRAIQLDPDDAWAHVYLANHLWRNGDVASAEGEFERARELALDRAFPLWSLANLYEDRQEWDTARRLYLDALEVEPDDAVANMNFGRMLSKKGEKALAKRYLLEALRLDPQYEAARRLLTDL